MLIKKSDKLLCEDDRLETFVAPSGHVSEEALGSVILLVPCRDRIRLSILGALVRIPDSLIPAASNIRFNVLEGL